MTDPVLVALCIFLGAVVASRIVSERGVATLGPDEKVRVMDAFAAQRKYSLLILVVLLAVAILAGRELGPAAGPVFASVIACYVAASIAFSVSRIRRLGMPSTYLHHYLAAQGIQVLGLAVYCAVIAGWLPV